MKLNIIKNIENDNDEMHLSLGVTEARTIDLFNKVAEIAEPLYTNASTEITPLYGKIAEICDNMEEYTLCMHAFIFDMARIGRLSTEPI